MSSHDDGCAGEIGERLLARVNADGGWGYYDGNSSRIEPTCWALRDAASEPLQGMKQLALPVELLKANLVISMLRLR